MTTPLQYKGLDLHQHCLHRPDTYIGSVQPETKTDYILIDNSIIKKEITVVPAITRLFIEALSNAIDNKWRSDKAGIPSTTIKVSIDESGETSVWNDGMHIPVEKNSDGIYIPQMIFGQLLTSSNYDDTESRYTSGRNGIGIKAVNIFSSEFVVECADPKNNLIYRQKWKRNMYECGKPTIRTKELDGEGYTKVSWRPDFQYFNTEPHYTQDTLALFSRHVYDTAMLTDLSVYLNKRKVPVKQFKDYVKLFQSEIFPAKEIIIFTPNNNLTFALIPSDSYEQISFVNGIQTRDGGVHADACFDVVMKPLLTILQSKLKKLTMRELKTHFKIFVRCSVPNPTFESQSKNRLTAPKINVRITDDEIKPLTRWSFVGRIKEKLEDKELVSLQKSEKSRGHIVIAGYERANKTGKKCSLILCEGLSAKTYAMTGISNGIDFGGELGHLKGKDWFGVLSLRGKCFAAGTMVRMANGELKSIERIVVGDAVMGDNFKPRRVETVVTGNDTMYEVVQSNGMRYVVSGDHLLVLYNTFQPSIWWNEEKSRWHLRYFDVRTCRLVNKIFQCYSTTTSYSDASKKPISKENGLKLVHMFVSGISEIKYLRVPVYTYIQFDEYVKNFLVGIRMSQSAIYKTVKHTYSKLYVKQLAVMPYFGFKLEEKPTFLLSDGTVVHNCLNVRNATKTSIANNKEITALIQALGLKYNVDYTIDTNYNSLRYGRVIGLVDADVDATHILSLIFNIFHVLFPSLMKRPDFFYTMLTPIIKTEARGVVNRFYNLEEARKFIASAPSNLDVKYYKGLGSSDTKDVKETFGKKVLMFTEAHKPSLDDAMKLAFDKGRASDRKEWLRKVPPAVEPIEISKSLATKTMTDFLLTDLVHFSLDDCHRNLPNLYDGLKVSQRKILYACFKKNLTTDKRIKVAQLAGYVSETTDYHHGEQCLQDAIIRMAQDYTGSNNIPLLMKDGAVGTRLALGDDAASARYVFVKMGEQTRKIFLKLDEEILDYIEDEGQSIEPYYYCPILPMLLVNGSTGIGTGWSTSIPSYNPDDLKEWINCWMNNEKTPDLTPWYRGFKGRIERVSEHKFNTYGVLDVKGKTTFITELPIGMSIEKFKETLDEMVVNKKIKSFRNNSVPEPEDIRFEIEGYGDDDLTLESLGLRSSITTTNLVALLDNNEIRKFENVDEIMEEFCRKRLMMYGKQKTSVIQRLEDEHQLVFYRLKFLNSVMKNVIDIYKKPENEIVGLLERENYPKRDGGYNYLLDLPVRQFTEAKLATLCEKLEKVKRDLDEWRSIEEKDLWRKDIN